MNVLLHCSQLFLDLILPLLVECLLSQDMVFFHVFVEVCQVVMYKAKVGLSGHNNCCVGLVWWVPSGETTLSGADRCSHCRPLDCHGYFQSHSSGYIVVFFAKWDINQNFFPCNLPLCSSSNKSSLHAFP